MKAADTGSLASQSVLKARVETVIESTISISPVYSREVSVGSVPSLVYRISTPGVVQVRDKVWALG
jgi:hypothetical protein